MNLLPTQWSDLSEVPARSYQGFRFGGVLAAAPQDPDARPAHSAGQRSQVSPVLPPTTTPPETRC
jgi:hypothetical protein